MRRQWCFQSGGVFQAGSPVFRHADDAVLLGDDDRRAHHVLEGVDLAQQTWLPNLRSRFDFGCHAATVMREPPTPGKRSPEPRVGRRKDGRRAAMLG